MGVSIQVYRCRIGTFAASKSSKFSTRSPPTCSACPSCFPGWSWSVCLVLVLFTLPLLVHHDLARPMQYFPKPCTTSSGTLPDSSWASPWGCRHQASHTPPWSLPPWPSLPNTGTSQRLPCPTTHPMMNKQSFITNFAFQLSKVKQNFIARMLHGNRSQRGRGIKLLHWNKGPSYLRNKQHEVETLIEGHKPHVLGLSEANFKAEHNLNEVQHNDYNLHTCPTLENSDLAISRVVVYTHQSLVVKRRHDLEDSTISAIWLELGLPQKKKIIVCNAYREWQHIGQLNSETGASFWTCGRRP